MLKMGEGCIDTEYPIAIMAVAFVRLCPLINSSNEVVLD